MKSSPFTPKAQHTSIKSEFGLKQGQVCAGAAI
jgi:hypothetical protein